ncbi:uncharacterized protein TNCV_3354301 [Trichonephila clavipes]|nr:uncharacterized protein TNCV_3354301 [Trichonephila clavipes]
MTHQKVCILLLCQGHQCWRLEPSTYGFYFIFSSSFARYPWVSLLEKGILMSLERVEKFIFRQLMYLRNVNNALEKFSKRIPKKLLGIIGVCSDPYPPPKRVLTHHFCCCYIWLLKLDWDSPLPEALATKWKTFQKEFEQVCSIHIPRWIHTASHQITQHSFCNASELAYASVIYAVQPQADSNTKVTLLVAKSRVAPLKSVSIPRLELNGALLLARLYATCKNILKEYDLHFYAWTDSKVVLSWLSSHPRN